MLYPPTARNGKTGDPESARHGSELVNLSVSDEGVFAQYKK